MDSYAVIDSATGLVVNTIVWDGATDYAPEDGFIVVENDTASIGWSYLNGEFVAPAVVGPTPEEILSVNTATRAALQAFSSAAMTPLLLSLQLGDATEAETEMAKLWQAYSRELKSVDLKVSDPQWPSVPA